MKSHAVVFTGPNQVSYQEISCPEPGPEDLVVELHHSWISNGTEGSFLRGERLSGDVAWRPGDPAPFPMVAGYQKVGRVTQVGRAVAGFSVGDWVFASMSKVQGMFDNQFAGHVSPSVCDHRAVQRLPAGADPLAFAGLVLTQVGFNCGSRSPITPGQVAVVIGDGLVGQWAGQTLARRGAQVVLVGRHPARLARFDRHGATLLSRAGTGAAELAARKLGPIQVLVATAGDAAGLAQYLPQMARGGHMVIAGFYRPAGEVNLQTSLQAFRNSELSFDLVSGATRARLEETLQWVADGRLDTLGCLTHRFPVEAAAQAWQLIQTKAEPVLGVVLDWPAARPHS
ncbi:MAG: zinc-binding dehydrogenase [Opitutales bacterium]|nr:zinc-binding dehydrogenase [Opitutales bacterium]